MLFLDTSARHDAARVYNIPKQRNNAKRIPGPARQSHSILHIPYNRRARQQKFHRSRYTFPAPHSLIRHHNHFRPQRLFFPLAEPVHPQRRKGQKGHAPQTLTAQKGNCLFCLLLSRHYNILQRPSQNRFNGRLILLGHLYQLSQRA